MSAPPPNAGALVGTRLGDYELVALLALGGTAEIYLARVDGHAGFEKYVVVKCLHDHLAFDPEFVQMFLDEARLGAQLDHSNIVQTLGLGEQDGRYYLVMEYVAGMSVALMARRSAERVSGSKIPASLVLGMAIQAAGGLHYAHERRAGAGSLNLVHRDISPQNLVVTFEGVVKIVDFGIAKAEQRSTATRAGTIKGKFAYMSPEQCVAKNVDRRTDVFALGVVVHELLTGRRLFKRGSSYDTYQAILECKVPPPSAVNHELDPALDAVIMHALAKDPNRRYQTAEAFGEAVSAYMHRGGKHCGAGDISTFIEQFFLPEIADHGDRMRELLEGRPGGANGWDDADDDAEELSGQDVIEDEAQEPDDDDAGGDFPVGASGFEDGGSGDDDSGAPSADSTRIEMNPLDRLAELNEEVRRSGAFPVQQMPTIAAPSQSLAAIDRGPPMPARTPGPPAGAVPAPVPVARNPGPPVAVFAAAKPGGSMFGGAARPGASIFGGAAGAAAGARPASASNAGAEPLKIASLFGGNTPASKPRRDVVPAPVPRPLVPAPVDAAGPFVARAPTQPSVRGGGFGPSVVPTVIAEPEPTPASRGAKAAPGEATMSIDLADVIADLPNLGARAAMEPASPPPPAGMGALAYGTPPGTPSTDGMPYLDMDQTHLPAHLIGLPPSDSYPAWDGTYPTPRRPARTWLLPLLFVIAIGLATGLTIAIARAVS